MRRSDVVVMGRATVDLYSTDMGVPLAQVTTFARYLGGCPANFAVGMARLGASVGFVGRVGDEPFGLFVREALASECVDTQYVTSTAGALTGLTFLEISPPDRFPFVYYRRECADLQIATDDLPAAYIAGARLFFTAGTGLAANPSREATLRAMELAGETGATTRVFDVDLRPTAWRCAPEERLRHYQQALRLADVVVGTETEMRAASGVEQLAAAVESIFASGGVRLVVVKEGSEGSTVYTREGGVHVAPFRIAVLNVLGAGDGYAAGFCYGLLAGWSPETSARFGNAVGALVATRHSCASSMPYRCEVEAFMARQMHTAPESVRACRAPDSD
jgi:5-dehydro-2-deoxygluconokinase